MKNLNYDPVESRWWKARVAYLLTYAPEMTARMFRRNKKGLYQSIAQEVDKALNLQGKLTQQGSLNKDQIVEVVQSAVAPTEGIPPEGNELPEDLYLEIRDWAENPPESPKTATML